VERGRGGTIVAGVVVTMLVDKARSLAIRRRARQGGREGAELAGSAGDRNGARDAAGSGEREQAASAADLDTADLDTADPEAGDPEAGDLDTADPEVTGARLAALLEPAGVVPGRLRGRDHLIARLEALVWAPDGRTHVLAGPGGSGKTAVALRVAREAARRGVPAWWVPAPDAHAVTARLVELAALAGARPGEVAAAKAGQRDAADLLWRYLEERAPWLLVIDGADDPDTLTGAGWLRRAQNGLVVVTSRAGDRGAWGRHTEVHTVVPLDPAAGGRMLADLAPEAGPAADAAALSERLGGLPLALRHAGCQLAGGLGAGDGGLGAAAGGLGAGGGGLGAADGRGAAGEEGTSATGGGTFGDYALGVDRRLGDAERDGRTVAGVTREMGLEALAATGVPQARALLRVLSFLAADVVIPGSMLDLDVLAGACDGDAGRAAEGLSALAAAGLVTALGDSGPGGDMTAGVLVHPVVADASRVYTGDAARAGGVAVGMLGAAAAALDGGTLDGGTLDGGAGERAAWLGLAPHVSAVYRYLGGVLGEADLAALTALAGAAAGAFTDAGCTAIAAEVATGALRHAQRLGGDHPGVLALRGAIARARSWHENGEGNEEELLDLLAAQLRVLGPGHQDTLDTGHQLARLLARQGEYERAERRLRDLLAARARTLGPDHPSTLTAWHDLGLVLAQRGQYAQAAREFSALLATRARLLGPDHRDTRVTRRWLAHMAAADTTVRSG
jgi:hypothetical protein